MAQGIYVSATEAHCGRSLVSLGIVELLLRTTQRVAVFRPIIRRGRDGKRDRNIDLLLTHFGLDVAYDDTFGVVSEEACDILAEEKQDDLLDRIIRRYGALEKQYDYVLVIGADFGCETSPFGFELDVTIAQSLGLPVVLLGTGAGRNVDEAVSPLLLALDEFHEKGCSVAAVIVNRAEPGDSTAISDRLERVLGREGLLTAVIPTDEKLARPTVGEIAAELDAAVLYGTERLGNLVEHFLIVAMQVENYLPHLRDGVLLITPGDRGDVVLSALLAHQSRGYPQIAGMILSTGVRPAESVLRLLEDFPNIPPILGVGTDTYQTASAVGRVASYITPSNREKIALSLKLFAQHVDGAALVVRLGELKRRGVPPRLFLYELIETAKANKQRIVLPEATDERVLRAAKHLVENEIVAITLLGERKEIELAAAGLDFDLSQVAVIDPRTAPQFADYVDTLYELRKERGLLREQAADLMYDVSYFGTMMIYKGDANGMVSGAVHSTAHTIRPALQFIKTRPGVSTVSSVFFMCLEDRVLVYGDCAINPNPTTEELVDIAIASADTSKAFGIEPRVAMLSYSTGESGKGEDVDRVRAATLLVRERRPDLLIDGPIQYDAAVDSGVGQRKMPGSEVAGQATVFIFPDLNSGNVAYKAVQRETGAVAVGPVLQGLRKPVNDLSRGCTVEDIINTVAITAIQAQNG